MKGPGVRIDLDVRRVWLCPRCGKRSRTVGGVTSQRCGCVDGGAWMTLEPPQKREPYRPPPRDPAEPEEVDPDDDPITPPDTSESAEIARASETAPGDAEPTTPTPSQAGTTDETPPCDVEGPSRNAEPTET
ncbi:MAG: hypothetical protein ACKV0T_08535 [Planctomycetales bacterium]